MIPCLCIDDTNRPETIPDSKWIKKGDKYHITHLYFHPLQNTQAVELYEKPLGHQSLPYVSYKLSRFAFDKKHIPALLELAKECSMLNDIDINKLWEELTKSAETCS